MFRVRERIALLLCGGTVAVVICEVGLRMVGYYGYREADLGWVREVDDEVLDHRREPGSVWVQDAVTFAANSAGWRDLDHPIEKVPGERRIVVLGDSIVEGYGVSFDETYGRQLAALLESGGEPGWRVVVLAMAGLNTAQEAHILRQEGLRYDPDLIILGYSLNDPERGISFRQLREQRERETLLPRIKRGLRQSSLFYLVYSGAQRLAWQARVALGREETADYVRDDYFAALHDDAATWRTVEDGFDSIRDAAGRISAPVLVLVFPGLADASPYPWRETHLKVSAAAAARGFEVLDLTTAFAPLSQSQVQVESGDHIHPNALGHRLAAEETYRWLSRSGLLDRAEASAAAASALR